MGAAQGLRRDVCPTICRGRVDSAPDLLRARLGTHHRISGAFPGRGFSPVFRQCHRSLRHWVADHRRWCETRNATLVPLPFPYAQYRPGQREFAVAVYRTIQRGERLFAEAPTGIGKTVSALYPALKALGEEKLERIFYLTARTTARAVAEKALADLRAAGAHLRSLTLTAKEKVCVQNGAPCELQTCPLARGYFDRNKAAMKAALAAESITFPVVDEVARRHQVCPFELALDLSTWVDIIICDYNYVFDPTGLFAPSFR